MSGRHVPAGIGATVRSTPRPAFAGGKLRSAARLAIAIAGTAFIAGCGQVIASAPPQATPLLSRELTVPNSPLVVAGKGARALYGYQFITRRFGADSTWGYRASDSAHARFRYRPTAGDSTRVSLEMWGGRCAPDDRRCLQADFVALMTALIVQDPPPSE